MNEAEYILRIILRARDEFAATFAKARTQIQGLRSDHTALNAVLKTTNDRVTSLNTRYGNLIKKTDEARAAMRELARGTEADFDRLANQVDKSTSAITKSSRAARAAAKETRDVNLEFDRLVDLQSKLTKQFQNGERSRDDLRDGLKDIAREARGMQKALDIGDDSRDVFGELARNAETAVNRMNAADKARVRQRQQNLDALRKEAREAEAAHDTAIRNAESEQDIERKALIAKKAAADAERERRDQLRQAITDLSRYNASLGRTNQLTAQQSATIKRYQQDIRRLGRDVDVNSSEFRDMTRVLHGADERLRGASTTFRKIDVDVNRTGRSIKAVGREVEKSGGWARRFDNWAASISYTGDSVAKLDNNLRGMIVLAALVFAQQLGSILIALAGQLVSVASSAVMAGSALAGMAAAGVAQALPAIGLIIASLSRLKSIMDAVNQSDTVRQQMFQRGQKSDQEAANRADTITNAQEALKDANDRVADAQRRVQKATDDLTKARRDGREELEDMILAERRAELAARGAVLSQAEAQDALRQAIASGETGTALQRRELSVAESNVESRDSRVQLVRARRQGAIGRTGDVEQLDSVKNARETLADARRGLEQAERSADRAQRALEQASRKAADAASGYLAANAALEFMLSQLTKAERRLYESIQRIRDTFRKNFRPITDIIINAFARGVDEGNKILKRSDILDAARGLAVAMARAMDRIRNAFTSDDMIRRFVGIVSEARRNLAPLTDIAIALGKAFFNIAEAAGPAFRRFIRFVGDLADRFLKLTGNRDSLEDFFLTGERHLESWIKLGLAVIHLFAALMGAGGADEGKRSIDDLTKSIDRTADRIENNGTKVRKFFRDAREATNAVLGVIKDLGGEMLRSFNPESVKDFAHFLRTVVIPAIGIAIRTVGGLVQMFTTFFALPVVGDLAKYGVAFLLFSKVVTGTSGLIQSMLTQSAHFIKIMGSAPAALSKFGEGLKGMGGRLGAVRQALNIPVRADAPKHVQLLQKAVTGLEGSFLALGAAGETVTAFLLGPWGIAIVATLAGLYLLFKYTGNLNKVIQGFKDAWEDFKDALAPAMKELNDAVDSLGISFGEAHGAAGLFKAILQLLSDVLASGVIRGVKFLAVLIGTQLATSIRIIVGAIRILKGVADVFIGLFTLDFDQVKRGLDGIAKGFLGIGKAIATGLIKGIGNLGELIVGLFKDAVKAVKKFLGITSPSSLFADLGRDIARGLARGARAVVDYLLTPFRAAWRAVKRLLSGDNVVDVGRDFIKDLLHGFTGLGGKILNVFRNAFDSVWSFMRRAGSKLGELAGDAAGATVNAFKNVGRDIIAGILGGLKDLGGFAKDIANAFIDLLNKLLPNSIDTPGPNINLPNNPIPRLAQGGQIGSGYGGGDRLLRLLEEGEHVFTKEEVRAAGGHRAIFALRAMLGGGRQGGPFGFLEGGRVGGVEREGTSASATVNVDADTEGMARKWRLMWREIVNSTRRNTNAVEDQIREMRVNINKTLDRLKDQFTNRVVDIEMSGKVHLRRLLNAWDDTFDSLKKVTYDGLFYVGHEANKALTGLGEKHINFSLTPPKADRKATGGPIGNWGERGKDGILAWLGRGEVVLNAMQQKAVNAMMVGQNTLQSVAGRVFGFHAGGYEQPGFAGGRIVGIPGMPGERIDSRIVNDLLAIIKKYKVRVTDGYATSGHEPGGEHPLGLAVDLVPGPGGNWDLVDKLAHWAEPSQNKPRSPFRWVGYDGDPNHGRGNHLHLSWLHTAREVGKGVVTTLHGQIGGLIDKIKTPTVEANPAADALRMLSQAAIRSVARASQKKLDAAFNDIAGANDVGEIHSTYHGDLNRVFAKHSAGQGGVTLTPEQVVKIAQSVGLPGRTFEQIAHGESNYQPGVVSSDGGWGLWQMTPRVWGAAALAMLKKLGGIGQMLNPIKNAMMAKFLYDSAGHSIKPWYGTRYVTAAARGLQAFQSGGEIQGPLGKAMGIIAHAGEWVVNPFQQTKLASMLGTSVDKLRGLIGFTGGPTSFQGGGEVGEPENKDITPFLTTRYERERIKRILAGLYTMSFLPLRDWEDVVRETGRVFQAITASGKSVAQRVRDINKRITSLREGGVTGGEADEIRKLQGERTQLGDPTVRRQLRQGSIRKSISALTDEGGLLEQMDTLREDAMSKFQRATQLLNFKMVKFGRGADRNWQVISKMDAGEVAARELSGARQNLSRILGEEGVITKALKKINGRLKDLRKGGVNENESAEVEELLALQSNLQQKFKDIRDAHAQALEAVFQAQVAQQQAVVDEINKRADAGRRPAELLGRVAQATGNEQLQDKVNQAMRDSWLAQANDLEKKIAAANAIGNTDLADQLKSQVDDFRLQAFESIQQDFQRAIDRINEDAQTRMTRIDRLGRLADVMASFGAGGVGGMDPIGAARRREDLNRQRRAVLEDQQRNLGFGLQAQLALPENERNQGIIKSLNDQLDELGTALIENTAQQRELTAATREAALNMITSRQQFQGGVQGTLGSIIEAIGGLVGNTVDIGRQIALTQDMARTLTETRNRLRDDLLSDWGIDLHGLSGLALVDRVRSMNFDQITAGMDEKSKGVFESLINEVLNNELALVNNTNTMEDLSGKVAESQTFSSTAWQWFRTAMFNNNMVLPQYRVPANISDPAIVAYGDASYSTNPSTNSGSSVVREVHQDIDVNYNEVAEAPSAEETANRVAWYAKTANTST